MAKKTRSLNPADAFRKAQRQKEIKRNKLDRKKARETALTKKDSSAIQAEINQLERLSKRTPSEENRLKELKNELSLVLKANEQKGIASSSDGNRPSAKVIIDPATGLPAASGPDRRHDNEKNAHSSQPSSSTINSRTMNWFGPDGKLLEPERSFYYDPVFNPFGVPPPGMPVRMKDNYDLPSRPPMNDLDSSATQSAGKTHVPDACDGPHKEEDPDHDSDENESEEENTGDEEDDIPLPEGSPPRESSEDDGSDDDIPLPEGSPPPKPVEKPCPEPLINRASNVGTNFGQQTSFPHPGFAQPQPFFPPPITLIPGVPPPPIIAGLGAMPFPLGPNGLPLPPPPPMHNFHSLPPPPLSAKLPAKPETTAPHKTNPTNTTSGKPTVQASATVTALPQLRDLKREATNFVPAAIRKKRKELDRRAGLAGLGDSHRIQAAPESFMDDSNQQQLPQDLLSSHPPKQVTLLAALKRDGVLSDLPSSKNSASASAPDKDDYDKFVESLADVLQ